LSTSTRICGVKPFSLVSKRYQNLKSNRTQEGFPTFFSVLVMYVSFLSFLKRGKITLDVQFIDAPVS